MTMEGTKFLSWKKNGSRNWLQEVEENEEDDQGQKCESTLPTIPQPETPREPMEFLSRSWSLSASEISKALAQKDLKCRNINTFDKKLQAMPEIEIGKHLSKKPLNQAKNRKPRTITRWFHQKETINRNTMKKKDIARIENAHMHTALSVAGLASALASFAAAELSRNEPKNTKMSTALASATELLASHCIELAESAGADHDRIVSVIRSAMGGSSASNLVTLTAAAATALRGEAALKARLPKEPKRNAAITPCEKGFVDTHSFAEFDHNHKEEKQEMEAPPCVGDLLHYTRKGVFQWKQVSIYINKKSQVIIKIKGKKAGAFTKKKKYVVYDVFVETCMNPLKKEGENQELNFGVKTAQGVLEFKCKNKVHKQKWINEIQELLLSRSSCMLLEDGEHSMRMLSTNRSI